MTWDEHETMELFWGPITRARVKKIKKRVKDESNELIAFIDKVMKEVLKIKFEGLEDGYEAPKVLMLHVITKEHRTEQVGEVKLYKGREEVLVGRDSLLLQIAMFQEALLTVVGY